MRTFYSVTQALFKLYGQLDPEFPVQSEPYSKLILLALAGLSIRSDSKTELSNTKIMTFIGNILVSLNWKIESKMTAETKKLTLVFHVQRELFIS